MCKAVPGMQNILLGQLVKQVDLVEEVEVVKHVDLVGDIKVGKLVEMVGDIEVEHEIDRVGDKEVGLLEKQRDMVQDKEGKLSLYSLI